MLDLDKELHDIQMGIALIEHHVNRQQGIKCCECGAPADTRLNNFPMCFSCYKEATGDYGE